MISLAPTVVQTDSASSSTSEGIWGRSYRLLTVGLILTVGAGAFEALAVATTLPATINDLGGLSLYGWAFSAFMLANLIGITVAGAEADRRGPAVPFVAGVTLFALGLVLAGLAPAMIVVIVGRAIQGSGAGVISSVAYAAIGRGYPESLKPRMLAVISSAWVVPGLVGPALAGLVSDHLGWRWVFLALAPLPPIAAILATPAMRRLGSGSGAPRDWAQIGTSVRLAVGAALLVTGLGLGTPALAIAIALVGVVLGLPALRRLLPEGSLRAAPGLPAAIATMGLLSLAFFGVDAFVPLALTAVRGQTATAAGLALTAATMTWTTGSWIQAQLALRTSRRRLVVIGLALIGAGIALIGATLLPWVPPLMGTVAWGLAGLGMGLAFSTLSLVMLETAPSGQEGAASAALQLANVLGIALGTGFGGVIIGYASASAGIAIQSLLMIGVTALAVAAASRLHRRPG